MLRADPNLIGNARQQNDNLIAVADAISLGDCFQMLEASFISADDRAVTPPGCADTPEAYSARVAAMFNAGNLLRRAISDGALAVWRIHEAAEVMLAPINLDFDNVRYGIYKAHRDPEPDMQGARLWVKREHWSAFLSKIALDDQSSESSDAQTGRPRIVEEVAAKLEGLYPDPDTRGRISAKAAAQAVSKEGLQVSRSTVLRALGRKK